MLDFDAVIIGGGPAGTAAAFTLARLGHSVCIIDKCLFPRDKLCGGLLTLRSKRIFEQVFASSWDTAISQVSRSAGFFHAYHQINAIADYKEIFFTDRVVFDAMLLDLARDAGVQMILGHKVQQGNSADSVLTLDDGRRIKYRYLVGCDGVFSFVSRVLLGQPAKHCAMAIGLELDIPKARVSYSTSRPEIYFGIVRWGYAWILPKKDHYTVGCGCLQRKNPDLLASFQDFLKQRFGDVAEIKIQGHYLPFGKYAAKPGKGNILLCGDAAGLADPITGEGIAYAMQSGFYAATAIHTRLCTPTRESAYSLYKKKYAELAKNIDTANQLKYLIFPKVIEKLFLRSLARSQSVIALHYDLLSDDISYRLYLRTIIRKVGARLWSKICPQIRRKDQ
jgi:menaquinone-9 beta-reductase